MRIRHHLQHHAKRWLVPHKHNDHRPHLIRWHGLVLFALVLASIHGAAFASRPVAVRQVTGSVLAYATDINVMDLYARTNAERTANGLPALKLDSRLNQAAVLKAQNMFDEDYWAHVSPSGIQPWYWFGQANYTYKYAGENLAKDFDTSSGAVEGWMNSPGHRANILNANYTEVGFGVMNGTLTGGQTTLVVAHYGAPAGGGTSVTANVAPATPKPAPKPAVASSTATPAPTPVPAIVATPAPATPAPAATPATPPQVTGEITAAPEPKAYSLFAPLALSATLGWSTYLTLLFFVLLFLVYAATHLAVWRKGLRRWRSHHYRIAATAQIGGTAAIMLYLATSGLGQVG